MKQTLLKINLDTMRSALSDLDIPKSEVASFAKVVRGQIIAEVASTLVGLAKSQLKTTRKEYINSIVLRSNAIELVGKLANGVESGMSAFDMKEGFANSPKAKRKKDGGWYLTVPFRLSTPNAVGINGPKIPRDIYRALLASKTPDTSGYAKGTRGEVANPKGGVWSAYEHKFSIFDGIKATNNPQTGKNTYSTFRRVSDKSDPSAFIHPGIEARNLIDQAWAQTDVSDIIDKNLDILF